MIEKNDNTGSRNTGKLNIGNRNVGNRNIGSGNVGNRNIGILNTGSLNIGSRNVGNRNTGYLNTVSPTKGLLFNKECELWDSSGNLIISLPKYFFFDVKTTDWISWNNMTDQEKEDNSFAESFGGYVQEYETDKTLHINWKKSFDDADIDDVLKTLDLPNFDYSIFEEITGITKDDFDKKIGKSKLSLKGKEVSVTIDGIIYTAIIK